MLRTVRLVALVLVATVAALAWMPAPGGAAPLSPRVPSRSPAAAVATSAPLPRVMAATGDSITRAFDVDWCCLLQDDPARSWSTGDNADVNSHYRRLLTFDRKLAGHNFNDAVSGAHMSDLPRQLALAAAQRADYVTVEMGANDLCTSSVATMTDSAVFEAQFRTALTEFAAARPHAQVLVASIPDIHRLWDLFHTNLAAETVWTVFGICQSMLNPFNTEDVRQQVVAREQADNAALGRVCAEFVQCRWDGGSVYATQFSTSDVSTVDYFHPSIAGQNRLAAVTWSVGYWPI